MLLGIEPNAFILSYVSIPFIFCRRVLLNYLSCPGWTKSCNPFDSASQDAGMIGVMMWHYAYKISIFISLWFSLGGVVLR